MTGLREQTAQELDRFLTRAGLANPWTTRRDASTRWRYAPDGTLYEPARLRLHRQLVDEQRETVSVPTRGGTASVIVTAGPPGAGKTTALAGMPELGTRPDKLATWVGSRPEGARNQGLFWAACRMVEDGHHFDATASLLGGAAQRAGLPEHEALSTIRSAYRMTAPPGPAATSRPTTTAEAVAL